ncbi:hypothetical protein GYB57_14865, partial [bacterium]|nr:hypothetical protein [bacterium]
NGQLSRSISLDTIGDSERAILQAQIAANTVLSTQNRDSIDVVVNNLNSHISADFDTDTTNERISSARLVGDSIVIVENDSTFYVDLTKYQAAINNDNDSMNELIDSLAINNDILEIYENGQLSRSISLDTIGDSERAIIQNQTTANANAIGSLSTRLVNDSANLATHLINDGDLSAINELQNLSYSTNRDSIIISGGNRIRIADIRDSALTDLADTSAVLRTLIGSAGDNLGNHTATQNINLGTSKLVGNGGTQGLEINNSGNVGIGTSPNSNATLHVESTEDKAAYFEQNGTDPIKVAVFGEVTGPGTSAFALEGDANSTATANYGLHAVSRGTGTGTNYGVYGKAIGGSLNWAGYFDEGNVYLKNKVGIGTFTLDSALNVNGGIMAHAIRLSNGAGTNKVLTSDLNGNARWENISNLFTDSDNQTLSITATGGTISILDGNKIVIPDSSATNELQNLSINGANDSLLLSDGSGVRLSDITSGITDSQQLKISADGDTLYLDNSASVYLPDSSNTNELQTLSLMSGNVELINADGTVASSVSLDDNDADPGNELQAISKSGSTVTLSNGGGTFVDSALTSTQVLGFVAADGYIKTEVDGSVTNELQDLSINGANDSLLLSSGTGVRLSDITVGVADNQNLSVTADSIKIESGKGAYIGDIRDTLTAHNTRIGNNLTGIKSNTTAIGNEVSARQTADGKLAARIVNDSTSLQTHIINDGDLSVTNELQDLSINGANDSLLLSSGTGVRLSDITVGVADNQNLSVTADSIKIESGKGAYIGDIRDTLTAHNTRIGNNLTGIKSNTTAIGNEVSARQTADGKLAARIVNDSTSLQTHIINDGDLSATNELQGLSFVGDSLKINGGSSVRIKDIRDSSLTDLADSTAVIRGLISSSGDNLGNHTATQNLNLGTFDLVGNGGSEGINISAAGNVGIGMPGASAKLSLLNSSSGGVLLISNTQTSVSTTNSAIINTAGSNGNNTGLNITTSGGSLYNSGVSSYTTSTGTASAIGYDGNGSNTSGNGKAYGAKLSATSIAGTAFGLNALSTSSGGTSTGYGIFTEASGNGATNYGLYAKASGAGINYSGYFDVGDVLINDTLILIKTFKLPTNSGEGKVLVSDSKGVAKWENPTSVDTAWNHKATQNIQLQGKYISNDGDSEGIHIAPNGNVTIGSNKGFNQFGIWQETTEAELSIFSETKSASIEMGASGAGESNVLRAFKFRGNWPSFSSVLAGDDIFKLEISAHNGSSSSPSDAMSISVDGVNSGNVATRIDFSTVNLSGSNDKRLSITNAGNVGIGNTNPDSLLTVNGGIMANYLRLTNGAGVGKVLTSSSNGSASWSDISSLVTQDTMSIIRSSDSSTYVSTTTPGEVNIAVDDTVFFEFDKRRLEFLNTNSIIIGEDAAINANQNTEVTAIGQGALRSNTTGAGNTAIGTGAILGANTTGNENTAVGHIALRSNTTGSQNTALGSGALDLNVTGSNNIAIGQRALEKGTTAENNVAIGGRALENNSGNSNVAIGNYSGNTNISGDSNIFIGHLAGYNEMGSNKLYIANDSTDTPLVFGDFAADALAINGVLTVDSAKNGSGYTFPGSKGSNGQVLTSDGSGKVTWKAPTVAVETCPSGMVAAGPKMCIETAERGATTWFTAALTCTGLGRKLPSWAEWYSGVSLGTGIANTTDDWEWVDGGTSNTVRKVGNGGLQNTANDTPTNGVDVTFRCVYYRR